MGETNARVALVHSFYSSSQPSGENRVVEHQIGALRRAAYSVALFDQRTDRRERKKTYPIEAALTVATGRGRSPLGDLHEFAPDVVHIHNLFPNWGRSWVNRWDGPIVATLHNFRPLCAAATFFRGGHPCTDCLDARSSRPAIQHKCYRGNRLQTLPVAAGVRFAADPVLQRADRLIVLSENMKDLYVQAGVDADRMTVLPNFLPAPPPPGEGGGHWLYVGRLSQEKGILPLVRQWPAGHELVIAGDGELRSQVEAAAPANVTLLGAQEPGRVQELLGGAIGLVFPSLWFEGLPMVYLEALAAGSPVLAWPGSSAADLVRRDGTGLVVDVGLDKALARALEVFPTMRSKCRAVFDRHYTEETWLAQMDSIYRAAYEETPTY